MITELSKQIDTNYDLICYEGSVYIVANYVKRVPDEIYLDIVAVEFSGYWDQRVNAGMNYE